nr:unnamed protein product [Digitaria exilis]
MRHPLLFQSKLGRGVAVRAPDKRQGRWKRGGGGGVNMPGRMDGSGLPRILRPPFHREPHALPPLFRRSRVGEEKSSSSDPAGPTLLTPKLGMQ